MHISDFDYELPEELIAQYPLEQRDASRMLVLDRKQRTYSDSTFSRFPDHVNAGDVVVINNTRVISARLHGERYPTGGHVEVFLVHKIENEIWQALLRPSNRLKEGAQLQFGEGRLRAEVLDSPGDTLRRIRFLSDEKFELVLNELGQTPLPPYIKRPMGDLPEDRERYQTVFARAEGAIAAPTAGLHFTPEILRRIADRGAKVVEITLHVGYGTFEPVRVENIAEHRVAPETFEITSASASTIEAARESGARILVVGTTCTRALESAVKQEGAIKAMRENSDLTITPGFDFRVTGSLLTNFHLPRSSLLLLVSAFAGREFVLKAYRHAVAKGYRFYSYGDCMLIL